MLEREVLRTADEVFTRCDDFFGRDPVQTNVIVTGVEGSDSVHLIRIGNQQTAAVALRIQNGYSLSVPSPEALEPLAAALPDGAGKLRLVGEVSAVAAIAGLWSERTGGGIEVVALHRCYRLNRLCVPKVQGAARQARNSDLDLVAKWLLDFGHETGFAVTRPEARTNARAMLELNSVYFWIDGNRPVAQLRASPDRYGVTRIGMVYTPPAERGRGYAAGLTATVAADQQAHEDVQEVTLFTQASNAGSNRLYRRLGFESASNTIVLDVTPSYQ